MTRRLLLLLMLLAAPSGARAEEHWWRAGVTAGANRSRLGGADPADSGSGYGYLAGARASAGVLPWLSFAAELVYARRQIQFPDGAYIDVRGELDISRFELPVAARFHTPSAPVSGFALAGVGLSFGASASHPVSDEGGEPEVDIASKDLFLDAGLGGTWQRGTLTWTVDLRYRHGLRTIDPESPGLDIRVHTVLLEAALEWTLR